MAVIYGREYHYTEEHTETLLDASKEVALEVNAEKNKCVCVCVLCVSYEQNAGKSDNKDSQ